MIANDWPAIQAARKIAMADEAADERRDFWTLVGIGAGCCFIALIAILAGVRHFDKDEAMRSDYLKAQYRIQQLEGIVAVGQKHSAMSVRVAQIPASDYGWDVVLEPKVTR